MIRRSAGLPLSHRMRTDHEGSAFPVVAVVEPAIEFVAVQVDLEDAALKVVEMGSLLKDVAGHFGCHRFRLVRQKAPALCARSVEKSCQDRCLLETRDIDFHGKPPGFQTPA